MTTEWSNLARVVFRRTYARKDTGRLENWNDTVERAVLGNVRGRNVPEQEVKKLIEFSVRRKSTFAGRGLWFSGSPAHSRIGGAACNNCWFFTAEDWFNFVVAQDLLMLGGGVGLSVQHKYVSQLPRIKKGVEIQHIPGKDAQFIVPDSREGWCDLLRKVLKSFFVSGKGFTYSTYCVRGYGEDIKGFGGVASGPRPLIDFVTRLSSLLNSRAGKAVRPIDAADILTLTAEMVVAGNVRRSAIIIIGDPHDKEYLKAKRWDLAPLPTHRSNANYSVYADDVDDLHPLFWKTYEIGEPFGIINVTNIQKYGRIGELKTDTATGSNPCGEATLESAEPCNLVEQALNNMDNEAEFLESSRLWFRAAKRVTMEKYHHEMTDRVIKRNRRVGVGITGCLMSPLFNPETLDRAYRVIQEEDERYSTELNIPRSIRTTLVKPSGTMSKVLDCAGYEGIHPAFSRYMIQRVRFSSDDPLIPKLKAAGHYMEPVLKFDGTTDPRTLVVDFYQRAPDGYPVADEDWDTWKQLEVVKMVNRYWSDQSTSVTVYYEREELDKLKQWLRDNLQYVKTISFLCHSAHGFKQAPKEAITQEQYEKLSAKIRPLDFEDIGEGDMESVECAGGYCPIK